MNTQGNTYTIVYASVMVILVAAGLSFAAIKLQPFQERNVKIEKKQNILATVHLGIDAANQTNRAKYIIELYQKHITESFIVDYKGNKLDGSAFDVDVTSEYRKSPEQRRYPVFIATLDDGQKRYILPLYGKGLWGPVWGYIALKEDFNTIEGVIFDHKAETPGLGAEIKTSEFQRQFTGKKIFNENNELRSVRIVKNQNTVGNPHSVDAISGGTITSNAVDQMLLDYLKGYEKFLDSQIRGRYEQ